MIAETDLAGASKKFWSEDLQIYPIVPMDLALLITQTSDPHDDIQGLIA